MRAGFFDFLSKIDKKTSRLGWFFFKAVLV